MTGMEIETHVKSRAGRPRSAESRRAILQAAMLILQTEGYRALTIEADDLSLVAVGRLHRARSADERSIATADARHR